jgi:hypothetical protein
MRRDSTWKSVLAACLILAAALGVQGQGVITRNQVMAGGAGNSLSVQSVNGETVVVLNGQQVYAGPAPGPVSARSGNVDGRDCTAVFAGDKLLWESELGAGAKLVAPRAAAPAFKNPPRFNRVNPNFEDLIKQMQEFQKQQMQVFQEQMEGVQKQMEDIHRGQWDLPDPQNGAGGPKGADVPVPPNMRPPPPPIAGWLRALPFGAFNFQQAFNGLGNGGVSISTSSVNGQTTTTVKVNGEEVYSGPSSGAVHTRTDMVDGEPRTLVLDGDKVLWDSRKPKDEFSLEKNLGPVLPAGLLLTDGTWLHAAILQMDDTRVLFRREDGLEDSLPLARVAILLFRPIAEAKRAALNRDNPGLLLRNGDYLESQPKSVLDGQVATSSILYGPKTYTTEEAVALVLRKPDVPPGLQSKAPKGPSAP